MNLTLLYSIISFYAVLVLVNIPAPFLGLKFESGNESKLWYAPPGIVVPIIWFVLFTLLGIGRYILIQEGQPAMQIWLYALAALCALYAYYTLGLARITHVSPLWYGLAGNLVVIGFSVFVVFKLSNASSVAAWLTAPVIAWTIYASWIVVGEMKIQKLI